MSGEAGGEGGAEAGTRKREGGNFLLEYKSAKGFIKFYKNILPHLGSMCMCTDWELLLHGLLTYLWSPFSLH